MANLPASSTAPNSAAWNEPMALPRSSDAVRLAGSPSGSAKARVPPLCRPCRQKEVQAGSRSQ
eukprot:7591725-Lingulodinium_polyedra.AAC.1